MGIEWLMELSSYLDTERLWVTDNIPYPLVKSNQHGGHGCRFKSCPLRIHSTIALFLRWGNFSVAQALIRGSILSAIVRGITSEACGACSPRKEYSENYLM